MSAERIEISLSTISLHGEGIIILSVNDVASFRCVRKTLEEAIAEVLERWGHLVSDNWKIEVRQKVGKDRGGVLSYGKNIMNIKASENWDDTLKW